MELSPMLRKQPYRAPTVLLVEDEPSIQEVLGRWLAEYGRCVVTCRTFHEARAYLTLHTPDILVTDIRLQDYNGLQLVMQMADRHPAARCLVITGHDDPVLRKEAEHMHAGYLLKPFGRGEFIAAIEHLASGGNPALERVEMVQQSRH
jgi:DNA-binding NtrC family response regulator